MARIRSIKPEFFTSDDIIRLSPLARILFIGLWCEADREGRLQWKTATLKRRYLPEDKCKIEAVCQELIDAKLVRLYGENLAYIPSFLKHQSINPREAASILPPPPVLFAPPDDEKDDASLTRARTRDDASLTHREERKGKESNDACTHATRGGVSDPFEIPTVDQVRSYCTERGNGIDANAFIDFYAAKGWMIGKNRVKDWKACVRTWEQRSSKSSAQKRPRLPTADEIKNWSPTGD